MNLIVEVHPFVPTVSVKAGVPEVSTALVRNEMTWHGQTSAGTFRTAVPFWQTSRAICMHEQNANKLSNGVPGTVSGERRDQPFRKLLNTLERTGSGEGKEVTTVQLAMSSEIKALQLKRLTSEQNVSLRCYAEVTAYQAHLENTRFGTRSCCIYLAFQGLHNQ